MSDILDFQSNLSGNVIPFPKFHTEDIPKFNGVLSADLWKNANKVTSAYPDSFDYTIYDRLHERFGDKQPRGGVIFKTPLKLASYNLQCSKCHYAFEIDTYGRGCVHNCTYCYAKDQLTLRGYWNRPHPMPIDISEIRKIFSTVFESDKNHKWREILSKRVPLRIGSMSDSFMWMDKKYRVTYELLKILKFYKYPHVIFTRSDLVADEDYMEAMDPDLTSIQFSISGDNEELTKIIEPGAPSVKRRIQALKNLSDAGFWTTVRINPLFPTFPDGYYTDQKSIHERFGSESNIPKLDLFDIENADVFFEKLKDAGVPSVLAGFVRLNQTSISQMSKATGKSIRSFFKPDLYKSSGESHYSDSEIAYYYKVIQSKLSRLGIRFNTCYIGNEIKDYYQYQQLWSNKSDCCDAVGNVSAFKTTSQSIAHETRRKLSPSKELFEATLQSEQAAELAVTNVGLTNNFHENGQRSKVRRLVWKKNQTAE